MKEDRITIIDIAREAGVSKSTVSRAINNGHGIDIKTKEVIKDKKNRPQKWNKRHHGREINQDKRKTEKKQSIIEKLLAFFEKYFGLV